MFIRKKKYSSGNVGIIVAEKIDGKIKELITINIAKSPEEVAHSCPKPVSGLTERGEAASPLGFIWRGTEQMRGGSVECGADAFLHNAYLDKWCRHDT